METKIYYLCFSLLSLHLFADTLVWDIDSDITVNEIVSGADGLLKSGRGTLTLSNLNRYSGLTTIAGGGAISITNDLNLGLPQFPVTLDDGKLIIVGSFETSRNFFLLSESTIDTRGMYTCNGSFEGPGDFVKIGAGALILNSVNNTYTGLTIIESGVLQAGTCGALSPNSKVFINASQSLDLNSYDNTIASLSGDGNVVLGNGVLTIAVESDSSFFGGIYGLGGIVKSGPAALIFHGTGSYSGDTKITQGVLRAGGDTVFSSNSTVVLADARDAALDCNGYANTISGLSGFGEVFLSSGRLTLNSASISTYFGKISGTGGITVTGVGSFQLAGKNNTYSGDTIIQNGTFRAIDYNVFSPNSAIIVSHNGTLELDGSDNEIANLSGFGKVYINDCTLAVGGNNIDTVFSGSISGTGGIVKSGTGGMCFLGSNSYAGVTTIQSGILSAGSLNTFSQSSEVNLENSEFALLDLGGFDNTIGGLSGGGSLGGNVHLGASTLTLKADMTTGYFGAIFGEGSIVKDGPGTLILYGSNNSFQGETLVLAGSILAGQSNVFSPSSKVEIKEFGSIDLNGYSNTIGNLSGLGSVILGSGTLIAGDGDSKVYSGAISGTGSFVKQGAGTLTLSGKNNTYSGETVVSSGKLQAGNASSFSSNSVVSLSSGILDLNGYDNAIASLKGDSGIVRLNGGSLTLGDEHDSYFRGQITGSGNLIKRGSSEFKLLGEKNTYNGQTIIIEGCFSAGSENAFSQNSTIVLANSQAVLDLRNHDNKIAGLEGSGTVKLSAATLSIHVDKDAEFSGRITSVPYMSRIIKTGSKTLTISGSDNSYSGITSIKNGTLRAFSENALSPNSLISIAHTGVRSK